MIDGNCKIYPFPTGAISDELFRHLANNLGDEWRRLAKYLNVGRVRIQAIMRQNTSGQGNIVFDMLVTWAKRAPRSLDKVSNNLF